MRKYIFVHLYNDRSGSPKVLSQVVRAVHEHGCGVEVLASNHSNGFLDNLPGLRRFIFYRRSENKLVTLFFYIISQVYLFFYCLRYWQQDAVFFVNTMMPFGAALAAKFMGKPVVYHVHETSVRPRLLKIFLRKIIELTASKVIFVSNYLRIVESFKCIPQFVVHNALSTDLSSVGVARASSFNVLMVCSLKGYKGVMEFLSVAKLLAVRSDISFTLVLNADHAEIDEFFAVMPVPYNVSILPRQADVQPFYSEASVLLNLSRPDEVVETFGLTIIEGMAQGLPVIVPPVGGPAEIVTDGKEGYLISCYEIERIVTVLKQMADNPTLHQQLANNALRRAQDFDVKIFNKRIVGVIDL